MEEAKKHFSRRDFLRLAGVTTSFLALQACGGQQAAEETGGGEAPQPAAAVKEEPAEKAPAAEPVTLKLVAWDYEPELVRENLDIFEEYNSDIKIELESTSGDYLEKLLAMFSAGTELDTMYVRDQYYASWYDAEFIKPIDGQPGLDELDSESFELNVESMSYKGHRLGTCYYTDFMVWFWNEELYNNAGVEGLSWDLTFDELRAACEQVKKEGILDYPLEMGWQKASNAFWVWWAQLYASGGTNITEDLEVKVDTDPVSKELLNWWVAAANDWQITNPQSNMETADTGELTGFWAEQSATVLNSKYDLERANSLDRSNSAREGKINTKFSQIPAFNKDDPHTSVHWTRFYGLSANTKDADATWRLMYYLGGKDHDGEYYTAKRWFLLRGLGFPFKPLWEDQEIIDKLATFADPDLVIKAAPNARPREGITAPWYGEWDLHHQSLLQDALLQKLSVDEPLGESGKKARELKEKWAA